MSAASNAAPPTSVFSHLDFREYLKAWLEARQASTPGYTLSRFARKAGCSYSHVRNVFSGDRKLLPPQLDGFIHALRLNSDEAEFFTILVRYQQSPSLLERAQLLQIISGMPKVRNARPLEGEAFEYLSRLSYGALYELAFSPDFREDPDWIGRMLGIPPDEAGVALVDLKRVGLLLPQADGGPARPGFAVLKTPPDVHGAAMLMLHDRGLEAAERALSAPNDQQHFFNIVAPIPGTMVEKMRESVSTIQARTTALLAELQHLEATNPSDGTPQTVFAVQVQLVPVTKTTVPQQDQD